MGDTYKIYTDGSSAAPQAKGDKVEGGFGVFITKNGKPCKSFSAYDQATTISRMELTALLRGVTFALELAQPEDTVELLTDSAYVHNPITQGWIEKWQKNGWRNTSGDVANQDLWLQWLNLKKDIEKTGMDFKFTKVKGHTGNPGNEEADKLAVSARKNKQGNLEMAEEKENVEQTAENTVPEVPVQKYQGAESFETHPLVSALMSVTTSLGEGRSRALIMQHEGRVFLTTPYSIAWGPLEAGSPEGIRPVCIQGIVPQVQKQLMNPLERSGFSDFDNLWRAEVSPEDFSKYLQATLAAKRTYAMVTVPTDSKNSGTLMAHGYLDAQNGSVHVMGTQGCSLPVGLVGSLDPSFAWIADIFLKTAPDTAKVEFLENRTSKVYTLHLYDTASGIHIILLLSKSAVARTMTIAGVGTFELYAAPQVGPSRVDSKFEKPAKNSKAASKPSKVSPEADATLPDKAPETVTEPVQSNEELLAEMTTMSGKVAQDAEAVLKDAPAAPAQPEAPTPEEAAAPAPEEAPAPEDPVTKEEPPAEEEKKRPARLVTDADPLDIPATILALKRPIDVRVDTLPDVEKELRGLRDLQMETARRVNNLSAEVMKLTKSAATFGAKEKDDLEKRLRDAETQLAGIRSLLK